MIYNQLIQSLLKLYSHEDYIILEQFNDIRTITYES